MDHTSYLSHTYITYKICGAFSDIYTWHMWRHLIFLHMWRNFKLLYMTNVKKSEIFPRLALCDVENVSTCLQFMLFCYKIDFVLIYAVLSQNMFCRNLRNFVWRKFEQEIAYVEKIWQIWGKKWMGSGWIELDGITCGEV